ncbi:MAG: sulfatase [Phycisphaerae bacterium]|nr:sulfatase [Phycisphaerae bacterium]
MYNLIRINRRQFLKHTSMLTFSAGLLGNRFGQAADIVSSSKLKIQSGQKPNILFISVDDLRIQLGCYGHTETISPNIDRLASEGTLFNRAYCQVPVCGPSRVSAMTGIRTNSNQWYTSNLSQSFKSLPQYFKDYGYHSISNGKIYHHMHDDENSWSEKPWRSVPIYHGPGDWAKYNTYGLWNNPDSANYINSSSGRGPYCESADVPDNAYQDGKVAQKTIADLRRLKKKGKPFFLACGFWRPHLPFNAPKKYWDMYRREDIDMAPNRFKPSNLPSACGDSGEINQYARVAGRKSTDEFHREARHGYYACVSYVDAQIGKILAELKSQGLADNTIVILWGDHGWHLGEHDFWGKHNTLNNALQVPMLIRVPGYKKNNKTNALVEFVDIYPSLCQLAGIPIPREQVQGTSFVPLLSNPDLKWKSAVFSTYGGAKAVKTDRYLYSEWSNARMLFDHTNDPYENANIAELPENAQVVAQMSQMLKDGWTSSLI